MGNSDYCVDLVHFWLGNLFRCMEGRQLARAGTVGLGQLKNRARTWRQLKTVGIEDLDSMLCSLCRIDFGKLNVRGGNDDW